MLFEQLIVIGLLTGAVYSLVGVGFTIVLGVGKMANFAHGSFVALGLYVALFARNQFGLNAYEALVPGAIVFVVLGIGVAELFEWRGRKIGEIGELLIGVAMLLLIGGVIEVAYQGRPAHHQRADRGARRRRRPDHQWHRDHRRGVHGVDRAAHLHLRPIVAVGTRAAGRCGEPGGGRAVRRPSPTRPARRGRRVGRHRRGGRHR